MPVTRAPRCRCRTFRDPRATSRLVVEKLDATNQAPLGGAEFTLWLDEDGNAGPPTNGDTSMGSCTTLPVLGRCSIPDLDFGTYYWEETAAPTGYDLPADRFSDPITIDATNAGTVTTTQMEDPRTPGTLVVLKTDAGTDEPLADAEFTLWLDQDGNDGPPTAADEQMGSLHDHVALGQLRDRRSGLRGLLLGGDDPTTGL